MAQKTGRWLKERLPLEGMIRGVFYEKIPGGANFFYALGSATMFVFSLQVLTGIWQLFYYAPTIDHAYESVSYLRINVPYGWLIHGIHYWGANIMAVLMALHIIRVFIWGAYKKPGELTWLIGVILLFLVAGLIFTGAALPWDETGYWASEVGTSIAGTVPVIGGFLERFLRGGDSMGQLTLSRFFTIHTVLIPALTIVIIVFHLISFRQTGSVGPWNESKRKKSGDFWPDQVAIDLIISGFIFVLIVWLSAFHPAPFSGPADPSDSAFQPRPEWNFLFLYQLLKLFKGPFEVIGTVGIPVIIVIILISVPFLDKNKSHSPLKRSGMMTGGLLFVLFVLAYTIIGSHSNREENISASVSGTTEHKGPVSYELSPEAVKGETIFNTYGCSACHMISGEGGKVSPDLTNEYELNRSKSWLIIQITNSKAHFPSSIMPDYTMLSEEQLNNLVEYLNAPHRPAAKSDTTGVPDVAGKMSPDSIRIAQEEDTKKRLNQLGAPGEAASIIGNVVVGQKLYTVNCATCHGIIGVKGETNYGSRIDHVPSLDPVNRALFSKSPDQFAENIDRFIQHGSVKAVPPASLTMFDYGDSYTLTQPQIANIEAYILSINNVNRAEIESPGSARVFFFVAVFIYSVVVLLIIIFWQRVKKKRAKESKI